VHVERERQQISYDRGGGGKRKRVWFGKQPGFFARSEKRERRIDLGTSFSEGK